MATHTHTHAHIYIYIYISRFKNLPFTLLPPFPIQYRGFKKYNNGFLKPDAFGIMLSK